MVEDSQNFQSPVNELLVEFGTRLNELEEKQRLLKDRVLLIGENLISTKENHDKESIEIKKAIKQMDYDLQILKQLNKRIVSEIGAFARKSEFEILERQFKMFEPMGFARIKDVEEIVKREISKSIKSAEKF